jgi:hypothetical protein
MAREEDLLREAIAQAEHSLVQATGNAPLCRTDANVQSAKYWEGQWAALRALRGRISECDADLAAAESSLETHTGIAWVSYFRGAVDALTELRASLSSTAT